MTNSLMLGGVYLVMAIMLMLGALWPGGSHSPGN